MQHFWPRWYLVILMFEPNKTLLTTSNWNLCLLKSAARITDSDTVFFSVRELSTTFQNTELKTLQLNKLFYLFIFYFITSLHPNFISEQPVLLAEGWPTSLLQSTRALWFLREFNLVHTAVDSVLEDEAMLLLQVKPNKGLVTRRSPMSPGQGPKTL